MASEAPLQVHVLPPPVRARVLDALAPRERRLVSMVCCSCTTLECAARALGISPEEARAMLRGVAAIVAAHQRSA